jgi:hypothetical protein
MASQLTDPRPYCRDTRAVAERRRPAAPRVRTPDSVEPCRVGAMAPHAVAGYRSVPVSRPPYRRNWMSHDGTVAWHRDPGPGAGDDRRP